MTENQLELLGFDLVKTYTHEEWHTRRFAKGTLEVEFTYLSINEKLETVDVTIEEVNCLPISLEEIKKLDQILNKTLKN